MATLVGDPPNVMISGATGFAYVDFVLNLSPVVVVCVLASIIAFRFIFADVIEGENSKIKEKLGSEEVLSKRSPKEEIKDWDLLGKSLAILFFVIGMFILHHEVGVTPATVALIGAATLLLITKMEMERIVSRVKWTTLLFFAGLFVVVHGVSETGLLLKLANSIMNLADGNVILSSLAVLFIAAAGSALVDNIPFTAAMIPIVSTMSVELGATSILWWALAFGAGFGGNATYIGSSASVLAVKISEDHGEPISFTYWFKYGFTIVFITGGIAALAIIVQTMTEGSIPLLPG